MGLKVISSIVIFLIAIAELIRNENKPNSKELRIDKIAVISMTILTIVGVWSFVS